MIFKETQLKDACVISIEKREDPRGFFARAWCRREFEDHGLQANFVQANISYNRQRGTVRGMHYQASPNAEIKLVRCIRGAIYDAIIDLRPSSPTYKQWIGVELTGDSRDMLYVPEGFAHGFQVLQDETEVFYDVTQFYHPDSERGVRYDDPSFQISWPIEVSEISEKDKNWPKFS